MFVFYYLPQIYTYIIRYSATSMFKSYLYFVLSAGRAIGAKSDAILITMDKLHLTGYDEQRVSVFIRKTTAFCVNGAHPFRGVSLSDQTKSLMFRNIRTFVENIRPFVQDQMGLLSNVWCLG